MGVKRVADVVIRRTAERDNLAGSSFLDGGAAIGLKAVKRG